MSYLKGYNQRNYNPNAQRRPSGFGHSMTRYGLAGNPQPMNAPPPGDEEKPSFVPYTSAFGQGLAGVERARRAGVYRSGTNAMPDISRVVRGFSRPNITQRGTLAYSAFNEMLNKKRSLDMDDFGIPAEVREQMKVSHAIPLTQQADVQKRMADRLLGRMGLLNDSARIQEHRRRDQDLAQQIGEGYRDIDIQSGLKANEQFLQNLNDVANLAEGRRQFDVGASLDSARLDRATQEWAEKARMNRAALNESIAEFLENYDLERLRISQGLVGQAAETSAERRRALSDAIGSSSGGGFGGFASGLTNIGQ